MNYNYRREHIILLNAESVLKVEERHAERFPRWFEARVIELKKQNPSQVSPELYALSCGPDRRVLRYKRCIINGYRFHTKDLEENRKTQNSGVCNLAEHEKQEIEFYGTLKDIKELEYPGENKVVLFECDWWKLEPNKGVWKEYELTTVNTSKTWYDHEPYILASQAGQVYYAPDIKLGKSFKVVTKNTPRDEFDFPEFKEGDTLDDNHSAPYQENMIPEEFMVPKIDDLCLQLRRFDVPATEIDEHVRKRQRLSENDISQDKEMTESHRNCTGSV